MHLLLCTRGKYEGPHFPNPTVQGMRGVGATMYMHPLHCTRGKYEGPHSPNLSYECKSYTVHVPTPFSKGESFKGHTETFLITQGKGSKSLACPPLIPHRTKSVKGLIHNGLRVTDHTQPTSHKRRREWRDSVLSVYYLCDIGVLLVFNWCAISVLHMPFGRHSSPCKLTLKHWVKCFAPTPIPLSRTTHFSLSSPVLGVLPCLSP